MKALTRFEALLESVVEGSFRRLFRGRIEPVDLARRLGRAMDDSRRVTWERPLAPNQYRITLAPDDFAEVRGYVESLQRELEKFATARAGERGYGMPGPASVAIAADAALAAGTFQVHATMVDVPAVEEQHGPAAVVGGAGPGQLDGQGDDADFGQTRAMRPLEMPAGPTGFESLCLVSHVGGRRAQWPISGGRVTIGRGLDNDVVLDDASVSRRHAEVVREGGRTEIRDLRSRNGTWVNARRVVISALHPGDQVALGAVQLEVARRQAD
jgi:hypothetical protein